MREVYKFKANDIVRINVPRAGRYSASYKARHSQSGVIVAQSTIKPQRGQDVNYIVEFENGDVITYAPQHLVKL